MFIQVCEKMKDHISLQRVSRHVMEQARSGKSQSRFVCRFIPAVIMKASGNLDEFEKQVAPVIEELLAKFKRDQHSPGVSYCVEFKNKNNAKVVRKDYYEKIRDMVTNKGYNFYVEYRDAEIDFLLEVYRDLMVFAVTRGYKNEWCKYNLQQIALASGAVALLNQGEKVEEKVA